MRLVKSYYLYNNIIIQGNSQSFEYYIVKVGNIYSYIPWSTSLINLGVQL